MNVESAEFSWLLEKTDATRGNLSVQIGKLKEAGYIKVRKSFRNNYPLTTCSISKKGIDAFEQYFEAISSYFRI
jgi:DNA-binding transcriptional ArsR family regulator